MSEIKSAADIAAEMVAALGVADPELDTSIGSVSRKIIDVVAEQVAPAYAINYLQDWIFSIETKSGAALDDFVSTFGIYRIPAKRATGMITFSRPTAAKSNLVVPANTFVITGTTPPIAFATVATAYILKGTKSVDVPIMAVLAGSSGNLPVGLITNLASAVDGVSNTVKQAAATSGGVDAESDAALRERFRRTIFRSLAGTEDMFLALALEDSTPDDDTDTQAVQANLVGPISRYTERVQIGTDGTATSQWAVAKYIYPGTAVVGTDIAAGQILTEGVHYTFAAVGGGAQGKITSVEDSLDVGGVYDFEFEYTSTASRNDPAGGITNRIDMWVSGVYPEAATETSYYRPQGTFNTTAGDPFNRASFRRFDVPASMSLMPTAGNTFLQLAWGPIIEFPDRLAINGTTYTRNVDYWVVHDDTAYGYSPESRFGLEFKASMVPPLNTQILLSGTQAYFYNRLPRDVEERAARWKLVTTDFRAHAAQQVRLRLNLAIMYSGNYERGVVQAAVDNAIATWINQIGFRSVVQVSDLLQVAHNVSGVDNVRFLAETEPAIAADAESWGIEVVNQDGEFLSRYATTGTDTSRAADIVMKDSEVPVIYDIRYITRAQNTWDV